jgi:hypothetical protein
LAIIGAPPSFVLFPPDVAVVYEISVIEFVETIGGVGFFVQERIKMINTITPNILNKFFIRK